jgi:hypothetical protein
MNNEEILKEFNNLIENQDINEKKQKSIIGFAALLSSLKLKPSIKHERMLEKRILARYLSNSAQLENTSRHSYFKLNFLQFIMKKYYSAAFLSLAVIGSVLFIKPVNAAINKFLVCGIDIGCYTKEVEFTSLNGNKNSEYIISSDENTIVKVQPELKKDESFENNSRFVKYLDEDGYKAYVDESQNSVFILTSEDKIYAWVEQSSVSKDSMVELIQTNIQKIQSGDLDEYLNNYFTWPENMNTTNKNYKEYTYNF